jgi:hypothetical protein
MEDKRILYVSSEVVPYLAENEVSLMSYDVPKMINDQEDKSGSLCRDMGILTKEGINYTSNTPFGDESRGE